MDNEITKKDSELSSVNTLDNDLIANNIVSPEIAQICLENILAGSNENIYWMDLEGRVLCCNESQAKFFGYEKAADAIGKTVYDFAEKVGWDKNLADAIRQNDLEVMRTRKSRKAEEVTIFNGKKRTFLSFKNPLINKKGEVIGVFGISVEITETKEAEEALRIAKEHAEKANRVKSEFLAVVSHELRIPLTGILGTARLLSDDERLFDPEFKEPLNDIIQSGEHLLSLVSDLLDLAKLEAGKIELHPAQINLRKIIEEVITALSYQAKSKGLEIYIDYPIDLPYLIKADPRALRQILINLLGNAVKFTEKGHIILKVSCAEQTSKQITLVLSVEDMGIGIPEDKFEAIFEKFNQVDGSRTRRYGGTGLGLAITKDYVQAMGGKISVSSQMSIGSTFSCLIPFPYENNRQETSPWEPYRAHTKVLIVDDTIQGDVLCKHLESSLTRVVSGKEALNILRSAQSGHSPFDIVIINQQLVSIDALQLGKSILMQRSLKQPMLLLLTAENSVPLQQMAKAAGFFTYFTKPIFPLEFVTSLTAAWEKWMEKNTANVLKAYTASQDSPSLNVLLVENNYMMQRIHSILLEKNGCTVDIAKNGKDAIEMLINNYDLIFMDICLPDIDVSELVTKINDYHNSVNKTAIPIIGLTSYDNQKLIDNSLQAGIKKVIAKPVKPEELQRILQN
jgi:PAS domain S-box-containing protein